MATNIPKEDHTDSESDLDLCDNELPSEKKLKETANILITEIKGSYLTEPKGDHFQVDDDLGSRYNLEEGASETISLDDPVTTYETVSEWDDLDLDCGLVSDWGGIQGPRDNTVKGLDDIPDIPDSSELPDYDELHEDNTTETACTSNVTHTVDRHEGFQNHTSVSDKGENQQSGKVKNASGSETMVLADDESDSIKPRRETRSHRKVEKQKSNDQMLQGSWADQMKVNGKVVVMLEPLDPKFTASKYRPVPYTSSKRFNADKGKQPARNKDIPWVTQRLAKNSKSPLLQKHLPKGPNGQNIEGRFEDVEVPVICLVCSTEKGHNSIVECCNFHSICRQCVEKAAKAVLKGEHKGFVRCSKENCTSSIPQSELRKALPSIVMDLLDERWKKETLEALADMAETVKCPSCGVPAFLEMAIKRFECTNCKKYYCRYCEMDWNIKMHTMCFKTKTRTSQDTGMPVQIPAHWTDDCDTDIYTTIELDTGCDEFLEVENTFHAAWDELEHAVRKIYRIQNLRLWERYSLMRSHMLADLSDADLNERRLFHGTRADLFDGICAEGFDCRLSGRNATHFGKGSYFSEYSWYSHRFCREDIGTAAKGFPPAKHTAVAVQSVNPNSAHGFTNPNSAQGFTNPNGAQGFTNPNGAQGFTPSNSQLSTSSTNPGFSGNSQQNYFGNSNVNPLNLPTPNFPFVFPNNQQASASNVFPINAFPNSQPTSASNVFPVNAFFNSQPASSSSVFPVNALPNSQPASASNVVPVNAFPIHPPLTLEQNTRNYFMFVARVLVGRSCTGHSEMRRPDKDDEGRICHSAIGHNKTGLIYVVFDNAQCYPEYVIQYQSADP